MWLIYCVNAFQNSVTQNLSAYVTSEFGEHSLLPVAYIVASAISAAVYLPTAKILDIFGRAEGFAFMASIATLGLILTAACKDVQTFAAAQTFCRFFLLGCHSRLLCYVEQELTVFFTT